MKLTTRIKQCTLCEELAENRNNVVIGEGPIPSPLVFLGEAPGRKEDETGIPFCGMAGNILETTAFRYGLKRKEHYHILNVLKCRPPENRDPRIEEFNNCKPFLDHQLKVVKPRVIVALGRYAQAYVLKVPPTKIAVLERMGCIIKSPNWYTILSCHPAYVARNQKVLPAFRKHIRMARDIAKGKAPRKCSVITVA